MQIDVEMRELEPDSIMYKLIKWYLSKTSCLLCWLTQSLAEMDCGDSITHWGIAWRGWQIDICAKWNCSWLQLNPKYLILSGGKRLRSYIYNPFCQTLCSGVLGQELILSAATDLYYKITGVNTICDWRWAVLLSVFNNSVFTLMTVYLQTNVHIVHLSKESINKKM